MKNLSVMVVILSSLGGKLRGWLAGYAVIAASAHSPPTTSGSGPSRS